MIIYQGYPKRPRLPVSVPNVYHQISMATARNCQILFARRRSLTQQGSAYQILLKSVQKRPRRQVTKVKSVRGCLCPSLASLQYDGVVDHCWGNSTDRAPFSLRWVVYKLMLCYNPHSSLTNRKLCSYNPFCFTGCIKMTWFHSFVTALIDILLEEGC